MISLYEGCRASSAMVFFSVPFAGCPRERSPLPVIVASYSREEVVGVGGVVWGSSSWTTA